MNILASLDKPSSGQVLLNGRNIVDIKEKEISAFRRDNLGFVFQDFNLLDTFSIQDNIFLPLVLSGKKYDEMSRALDPIAAKLGIKDILQKYPMRCPAARSSAPPSPARLSQTRNSSSPTSRPARSTQGNRPAPASLLSR